MRQTTTKWLKKQNCTVVAYYGNCQCDLWEVLDIYAQAAVEGNSTEDALWDNFPLIAEDLQVKVIPNGEYSFRTALTEFESCPQKIVFCQDEQLDPNAPPE